MTKRKTEDSETPDAMSTLKAEQQEQEPQEKPKKSKKPKTTENDVTVSVDIEKVFNLILQMTTLKNQLIDITSMTANFYDVENKKGPLKDIVDIMKKYNVKSSLTVDMVVDNYNPNSVGYVNDIITMYTLPGLRDVFKILLAKCDNKDVNKIFVKVVEDNMELISDNYKGDPKDYSDYTMTFLKLLIEMYEKAWFQTYIKESNYISSKSYVVAVSNRIHALYWHIKPTL